VIRDILEKPSRPTMKMRTNTYLGLVDFKDLEDTNWCDSKHYLGKKNELGSFSGV